MNLDRNFLRQHGLTVAFAAAVLATACGGTFSDAGGSGAGGPTAGAGGSGAGGPTAGAGGSAAGAGGGVVCNFACPQIPCDGPLTLKPGQCCGTCESNSGTGGLSSGDAGGSGGCLAVACLEIGCGPGFVSVLQPGACCSSCVPDGSGGSCGDVACPAIACANGYASQQAPGSCCPTCVPSNDCELGQQSYNTLQQQLLAQPGAIACKVNNDCTLLGGNAYCGEACSAIPVNAAAAQSINNELQAYAANKCSTCTPLQPPCPSPRAPACIDGQCTSAAFATQ